MKRRSIIAMLHAAALAASASGATVDVAFVGGSHHDPDGAGFGVAGAQTGFFRLTVASSGASGLAAGSTFLTFRLDMSPVIHEGLHTFSVSESVSPFGSSMFQPAALSSEAAYLYSQFRAGRLTSGANFSTSSESDLDALQDAIWHFQGLLGAMANRRGDSHALDPLADESTAVLSERAQYFVNAANAAVANGQWSGIGNVRVLNASLIGPNAGVNDGANFMTVVPLPGPAGVAAGSLLLLGARRRRPI